MSKRLNLIASLFQNLYQHRPGRGVLIKDEGFYPDGHDGEKITEGRKECKREGGEKEGAPHPTARGSHLLKGEAGVQVRNASFNPSDQIMQNPPILNAYPGLAYTPRVEGAILKATEHNAIAKDLMPRSRGLGRIRR